MTRYQTLLQNNPHIEEFECIANQGNISSYRILARFVAHGYLVRMECQGYCLDQLAESMNGFIERMTDCRDEIHSIFYGLEQPVGSTLFSMNLSQVGAMSSSYRDWCQEPSVTRAGSKVASNNLKEGHPCKGCVEYVGISYGGQQALICAMHPFGVEGACPDKITEN